MVLIEVSSIVVATRMIILENLSMMTRMALNPFDWIMGQMRLMKMCSQGVVGIACGQRGLCSFSWWTLVCWHGSHDCTYYLTCARMRGAPNSHG